MQGQGTQPAPTEPFQIIPWWSRLDKVLLYPFSMTGIVSVVFLVVVDFLRNFAGFAGIFGLFLFIILTGIILSISFAVVRRSSDGFEDMPEVEFTDIWSDWAVPGIKFMLLTITLFGPAVFLGLGAIIAAFTGEFEGLGFAQAGMALLLAGIALLIYPLAITILAMSHSYVNAINPLVWFQILSRVAGQYALVLGAIVVFVGMGTFATVVLLLLPIPVLNGLLAAAVRTYLTLVGCHLLGWFMFQNHETLGLRPIRLIEEAKKRAPQVLPQVAPQGLDGGQNSGAIDPATRPLPAEVFNPPVERQLPDMTLDDEPAPQFPGAFSGGVQPNQVPGVTQDQLGGPGQAEPGWDQAGAEPDAAPGTWNPFAGMPAGAAAAGPGGFLEVDDPLEPVPGPMGVPGVPEPAPQPAPPQPATPSSQPPPAPIGGASVPSTPQQPAPQQPAPQQPVPQQPTGAQPAGADPWGGVAAPTSLPGAPPSQQPGAAPDLNWQPQAGQGTDVRPPDVSSGLELDAPPRQPAPGLEPVPEQPAPAPAVESAPEAAAAEAPTNGAAPTPEAPAEPRPEPLSPELQALADRFDAALTARDEEYATITAGELIAKLWEARLLQRAHDTYRRLCQISQNACLHPNAQIKIARELDAMGDGATALAAWRALVVVHEAHPQAPRALLRCGELYIDMGRSDWAKTCYETILQKYPHSDVASVASIRIKQMS